MTTLQPITPNITDPIHPHAPTLSHSKYCIPLLAAADEVAALGPPDGEMEDDKGG